MSSLSNIDRYKTDLASLQKRGSELLNALQYESEPKKFREAFIKEFGPEGVEKLRMLPSFRGSYQLWYSEAKATITQLLPSRLDDFVRQYEKPKSRKAIQVDNYCIEDCLHSVAVKNNFTGEQLVGPMSAVPKLHQQIVILESVARRFESSLFDVRHLLQADLFDSELDAADELLKKGFVRAAGAITGVVLERHLSEVSATHKLKIGKKNPGIADWNEALRAGEVTDLPQWRFIQHLADLRNICDHNKQVEPTSDQVRDLIAGTRKTTKTLF